MSAAGEVARFRERAIARARAVFHESVFSAHRSIVQGSPLTGAPGQPVQYGALRQSWQIEILSPTASRIGSRMKYARSIEDGVSYAHGGIPLTIRSKVGGTHSVQKTVANFDRIVSDAVSRVGRSAKFGDAQPGDPLPTVTRE